MRLPHALRPPVRPLPMPRHQAAVVVTGPLGFRDAAEDDRRRWIGAFKALLDGLETPLQVVLRCAGGLPGGKPAPAASQVGGNVAPPPTDRRRLDLEFAAALRGDPRAQRQEVCLVAAPAAAGYIERSLVAMGLPGVRRAPDGERPRSPRGTEAPGWWWDETGLHRTWFVQRFPGSALEPGWLLQLAPAGLDVSLSWHAERVPRDWMIHYLQRQLVQLRASELARPHVADPEVGGAVSAIEALQARLAGREENAFHVALYLTVSSHGPKELDGASEQIEAAARSTLCLLRRCTFRQLDGRAATLPLGVDPLRRRCVLDTSSLATLFPWLDVDLQQPSGLVIGASRTTRQPVIIDNFDDRKFANANVGVFGHSGAGKTYLLSTLAMGSSAAGTQVLVVDPEHEYGALAELLGGVDVQLAIGSGHALNVLDLRPEVEDDRTMGAVIADAVDLCAVVCGGLDEAERAELEKVTRDAYEAEAAPVIGDVARRLDQSSRTARVLERWVQGGLGQMFSRPTTVDLDAPIVVFGMRELRAELVAPVHFLLAEALWGRIKRRDRRRLLVVDELGLLFDDPTIRQFVVTLARRIRKYDGSLLFATQNPGDLLSTEAGVVVATNPAIQFFGAMRPGEAARLQHQFQLSDRQRAMLESARRGEFLLAAGSDRVPVIVQAPPWQAAAMHTARPRPPPGGPATGGAPGHP